MSGTNHVLPTGGTAKFYSALGVYDFVKYSSYSYYPKNVLPLLMEQLEKSFINTIYQEYKSKGKEYLLLN